MNSETMYCSYTSMSLHGLEYFVLHPSFKRPFSVGKNWDFVLRNRVKVYYYFATMQLGSIINYKEESLLHFLTLGVWKHCEVTSKIRFDVLFGGMGLWKTLQLRFPFQNRFTVSPSYCLSMSALKREENVEKLLF